MCPIHDGIEDTNHFLLLCHSFDAQRLVLLDGIKSILQISDITNLSNSNLLKIILYGDERLTENQNKAILEFTLRSLRYIQTTEPLL